MNSMTYSTSDISSIINNISISVNRSNYTLVFYKDAYHANPGAGKKSTIKSHIVT